MHPSLRRALTTVSALAVCAVPALAVPTAATAAVSPDAAVVIAEIYGGGGNSGATYTRDFIELHNTGGAAVDLSGWSIQYAAASSTGFFNGSNAHALSGVLPAGERYLVRAAGGANGVDLPVTPNLTIGTNLSASAGKVALVRSTTALGDCGTTCASLPDVVDFVGFGSTASAFAGAGRAPSPANNASSISRDAAGTNTANNAADFTSGPPTPEAWVPTAEPEPEVPAATTLTIEQVQGTGAATDKEGTLARVRGVVTAAYPTGGFNGFVIQTPGSGGAIDPAAHDGSTALYVFSGAAAVAQIGQYVEVVGTVTEFRGLTQVDATRGTVTVVDEAVEAPKPVTGVAWPATEEEREDLESMLFEPFGEYTVTNNLTNSQFSEIGLAFGDTPLVQPTDVARPGTPELAAVVADNLARAVVLDDGASTNYSTARTLTPPYLTLADSPRVGAQVIFPDAVVIDYRFNLWRLQPRSEVTSQTAIEDRPSFEDTRTAAPDAARLGDGDVRVAAFNVLNYFTTLGVEDGCQAFTDRDGNPITVRGGCDQRGAYRVEDFQRQESKIVDAINALDADVVGLMEIENSLVVDGVPDEALATLVAALNADAGAGTWAYVPSSGELPPVAEMDVISNAIIYRTEAVRTLGQMRVLSDLSGEGEAFSNAREPLGQAFVPTRGGEPFFVVVNHFKSKGSGVDAGDGQGAANLDRVAQATALRDWLPTVTDDERGGIEDVFLVGDFNSYTQEDPLQVLYAAGYVNATEVMAGLAFDREYSYSFDGRSGSLDHVLMSTSVLDRFTGADIWEINSPEPVFFEYSRYNSWGTLLFEEGPYRSSDHDPIIVAFSSGADADAGRPDHAGPPPHAGVPGVPPHAGVPGPPPHAGEPGPPPHARGAGRPPGLPVAV